MIGSEKRRSFERGVVISRNDKISFVNVRYADNVPSARMNLCIRGTRSD